MRCLPTVTGLALAVTLSPLTAWARPTAHTIEHVPFVKQAPQWCGPAALESVLRFHGLPATQREIADEIALPGGQVLNLDLKLYARRKGFRAESSRGDLDRLKQWISRDIPVICQWRVGGIGARRNHFVVVLGYDDGKRCFTAHTGTRAAERISYPNFARWWRDARNWMLVIRPQQDDESASSQPQCCDKPSASSIPSDGDSDGSDAESQSPQ